MEELQQSLQSIIEDTPQKLVLSKPTSQNPYKKTEVCKKQSGWQCSNYTQTQVFHQNISEQELFSHLCQLMEQYRQLNAWTAYSRWDVMISKKGKVTAKRHKESSIMETNTQHNRTKQYIIAEGTQVPPLVDMGVFTKEGKVAKPMYDKFRQINRFLEMVDDHIRQVNPTHLNIIDFGCGKSYLTFVLYYYLTQIRNISVEMVGLDLKADVIEKCNRSAQAYGYDGLRFELGDINGYSAPFAVDMVVTLHACDTATDFALFNALQWGAKMIFSVPCCQHQLNSQMKSNHLSLLTRYGIVKERTAALMTDAIRANLLEYCGYKTQLLEFVDFAHTPKNILIRAIQRPPVPMAVRKRYLQEVHNLMDAFSFSPELYKLLEQTGQVPPHNSPSHS